MFVITKEQAGRVLQTQLMLEEIEKNLKQRIFDFSVELRFEEVSPQVYAEDFAGKTEKLIAFGTDLSRSTGSTHNVVKALEFNEWCYLERFSPLIMSGEEKPKGYPALP